MAVCVMRPKNRSSAHAPKYSSSPRKRGSTAAPRITIDLTQRSGLYLRDRSPLNPNVRRADSNSRIDAAGYRLLKTSRSGSPPPLPKAEDRSFGLSRLRNRPKPSRLRVVDQTDVARIRRRVAASIICEPLGTMKSWLGNTEFAG